MPSRMLRARRAFTPLLIVTGLLAPWGCVSRQAALSYPPGADTGGPPRRGGHLVLVREEDPDYLDPALSYGTYSAAVNEALYHSLLDYAHVPGPAGARIEPDLAAGLPEVRERGTLYCFALRPDARFGAPLHRHITADDFKYGIQRLFKVGSPGINFYRAIAGAQRVIDGRDSVISGLIARGDSLYIRLIHPDPVLPFILAMPFTAPIPREVAEKYPNSFSQHTVATGPYQVAEFVPRRHILMVRNPDYCGTPGWLDTIEVRFGVTAINAVALIRRGDADGGFFEVPAGDFARLRRDSVWRNQVSLDDGLHTEYLFCNLRKPPFNDPRVREAIAWALDRRAVLKTWAGKGVIAGEFLPPGMPGAVPLGRYDPPDRERARRLLREAGFPNGFSTRLYGWTTEPGPRELEVMQQQLAEVGIRAQLDLGEAAGYVAMANDTSQHIAFGIYSWTADYVDASNFFDPLLNGRRIQAIHNENLSLFDDADFNQLVERAMQTPDDSTRARMWREADRMVMERLPVVPLIHAYESRLWSLRVGGWYRHITRILKLEDLYIKQPGAAPVARLSNLRASASVAPLSNAGSGR